MKKALRTSVLVGCAGLVSGCIGIEGTMRPTGTAPVLAIGADGGRDSGSLAQLEAGIYIDPDGCHIWMIDDGLEGYWSRRRDPVSGLPVCTEIAPPNSVVGSINSNEGIPDRVPRVRN